MDTLSDTYNNYIKTSIIKPPISKFELIYDLIKKLKYIVIYRLQII
jgi:hypothetical protein